MDEFKPRSIEVLIEQAHMFGIEGDELREFVLNQQKLDLERLKDLNRQKLDLERLKLELERKAIEVVKLEMDEFKPRSIEVLIEQAHIFGIEGDELREFVLNQQKLDLERLKDLNRQKLDLERSKLELQRKAIEVVKLKMELEVKLSLLGDVNYKIEIDNDILTNEEQNNCQDIDNNISGIEDNEEIENVLSIHPK
ncbi:myb/SANT-like DNA-binding domain-containing protein 4 [Biomphalaria glabrata]|uniref:Myb/SANT-like DNA-binding domain-containing protein 4 n=1 Tax=Biomphalaria glabrata TaxID=6526 RepID=A0A9W3A9G1_BIOGL|nr:myb/SANT-like DNA-binding domain-containing protein 4 [Biomphalaria glabrata]